MRAFAPTDLGCEGEARSPARLFEPVASPDACLLGALSEVREEVVCEVGRVAYGQRLLARNVVQPTRQDLVGKTPQTGCTPNWSGTWRRSSNAPIGLDKEPAARHRDRRTLMNLPGIGPSSAAGLLIEVGGIILFPDPLPLRVLKRHRDGSRGYGPFVRRSDGRPLRSIGPVMRMAPYVADRRTDAQVFGKETIFTDKIDSFLAEKRSDGRHIGYTAVMIAALVRTIAERPQLNRFVVNGRLYARYGIHVSMMVKRSLDEDAEETSTKLCFTGTENIFDVAEAVYRAIAEVSGGEGDKAVSTAERIMAWPGPTKKSVVGLLKVMDRYNVLPRPLVEVSPFHASVFFSQLKSIRSDYVYHHLWNVGTAGIFVALGKAKDVVVPQDGAVVVRRACEIGLTVDERMCDGLYLSRSLELLKDYLEDPRLLEQGASRVAQDVP